ncbi:MAG: QueT transporter family protein [Candidatus Coatesbacteria bacterium]|nr:MAG: QueT transporter family protein [Candidatus Coatesbacteria bacterium]
MRLAFQMWGNVRMIVLTALVAAIYAAILIPFKIFTLVPGLTEMRPAAAIPMVVSLFFGPAGAFGVALGNLIGDFAGTLGWGSLFGIIGNFLLGYIPYKMITPRESGYLSRPLDVPVYVVVSLITSTACATFIGWAVDLLGLAPFTVVANIIALNNLCFMLVLSPLLIKALEKRVRRQGLMYFEVMGTQPKRPKSHVFAVILVSTGALLGLAAGNALQLGLIGDGTPVGIGVAPFVLLLLIGTALL